MAIKEIDEYLYLNEIIVDKEGIIIGYTENACQSIKKHWPIGSPVPLKQKLDVRSINFKKVYKPIKIDWFDYYIR